MKPLNLGAYGKFITAIIGAGVSYVTWRYGGGNQWVVLAVQAASALGVYGVPNKS